MAATLHAQQDYLLFASICIALIVAVQIFLRAQYGQQHKRWPTWIALVAILGTGWFGVEHAANHERTMIRQMVEGFGPTYAAELSQMGHHQITLDTASDDPAYLAMIHAQIRWLQANPSISDVYTFRKRDDGAVVLLVDSETDYNRNGQYDDDREQRTTIGEEYDVAGEAIELAFAGQATFDDEPYTDRWGTWVSANVPIYDPSGAVDGVLGVDFPAAHWVSEIARVRMTAMSIVGAFVVALAAVITIIAMLLSDISNRKQSNAALLAAKVQLEREMVVRKTAEESLAHEASHDALTGLPNRAELLKRLQNCINVAQSNPDQHYAVLFLDLDNFKHINDGLGHAAGDELLVQVAKRLEDALRCDDLVAHRDDVTARLGGDEFVVLLNSIRKPEDALVVDGRIHHELARPFTLAGQSVVISSSVGVVHNARYTLASDLLRDADIAMYRAKHGGKSRHAVFDETMRNAANQRLKMETDLRDAIKRRELTLSFQPIVRLETAEVCGFEALARWIHPVSGAIPPDQFIAVAEESGLIIPLGMWALEEACMAAHQFNRGRCDDQLLTVAVNLSKYQMIHHNFVASVHEVLERTKTSGRLLKFEITESAVMANPKRIVEVLTQLRELGIEFCMDDFGTGHSSLSGLHELPLDVLKIDRSFIRSMTPNRDYASVVHAIVALAHNLGLQVTAEGIERPEQLAQMIAMDCDYGQGYLFSPAMPADEVLNMLKQDRWLFPALANAPGSTQGIHAPCG